MKLYLFKDEYTFYITKHKEAMEFDYCEVFRCWNFTSEAEDYRVEEVCAMGVESILGKDAPDPFEYIELEVK